MGVAGADATDERMQLDDVEFPAEHLDAPGSVLPSRYRGRPVDLSQLPVVDEAVPADGWRLIRDVAAGTQGQYAQSQYSVLAAPAAGRGRWWVIWLRLHDDVWVAGHGLEPDRLRPSQARRRTHLLLEWPSDPLESRGDDLDHLTVRLTNTAREAWVSDPEDRIEFVAWITDLETGELFPYQPWQADSGPPERARLAAGEAAYLRARVITLSPHSLPNGWYGLTATLTSLNLRSRPGRLHLAGG
jgi:hypothetical protein